jgi:hypothetical protein
VIRIESNAVRGPAHILMGHIEPPLTNMLVWVSAPHENLKLTRHAASTGLEQNAHIANANHVDLLISFPVRC